MLRRYCRRRRARLGREARVDVPEQPLEDEARVRFRGHGGRRTAPRNAVGVGARIAGIAVADRARVVASELERREARVRGEMLRRDLIDRNAVLDVGAGGLARVHAREIRGARTRVVAGSVAERVAVPVREAGQHDGVLAERLERLHDPRELEPEALPLRRPVDHRDAVGHVGEAKAERRLAEPRGRGKGGRHCVQHRQRDGRPHALQEGAPVQMFARDDHGAPLLVARLSCSRRRPAVARRLARGAHRCRVDPPFPVARRDVRFAGLAAIGLRDRNGRLLTISRTRLENL